MNCPIPLSVVANWLAYSPTLQAKDIRAACRACAGDLASDGFTAVELPIAHMDGELDGLDEAFWQAIRVPFTQAGIAVRSVHGPVFSFDKYPLEAECERIRAYARAAVTLGASALVVHPVLHASLHVCPVTRAALARDIRLAQAACSELEGTGCRLAIENVPHNSWAYLEELFRHLPESAGMCFDTGHYFVRPERSLEDAVHHFAPRIACWHLNDNHGLCDEHLPPGDGSFPWEKWLRLRAGVPDGAPFILEVSLADLSERPDARDFSRLAMKAAIARANATLHPK